jgi:hypothetical protein
LAFVSASVVAIGPLAAAVLAAIPGDPPPPDAPIVAVSPVFVMLQAVVRVAPLIALVLAVLFRARMRTADGRRLRPVLAIRVLALAGLATLALGIAAVPVCARLDNSYLFPGIECMIPGVVLSVVGVASFILHAPLARIFTDRPASAAWLAVLLSVPAVLAYTVVTSALNSAGA